jgi:hypothetical protein
LRGAWREGMQIIKYLASMLFVQLIVLSVYVSLKFLDLKSTAVLLIFNFLFISLTWKLNGDSTRKLGLLATGNMLGLAWNYAVYSLVFEVTGLGGIFGVLSTIVYPFLDSIWIVTFWSLSLTVLPKPRILEAEKPQLDY